MITYISLLRGINVSGRNMMKMNILQKQYENMGFRNISTYLQSGNVIFSSDCSSKNELQQNISQQIEKNFALIVPVVVLTVNDLKQIINKNPFGKDHTKNPSFLHITFLASIPDTYNHEAIENKKQPGEEIAFSDAAVYLYCPNGYGKTKLTNTFLENRLKVVTTTRNWKTTNELLKIVENNNR